MCVLYNKASSSLRSDSYYLGQTHLISHIKTQKHTQHTQGPLDWHTHINTYLHHLLFVHSSYLYYIKWLSEKFIDNKNLLSAMSFLFKNSLVNVIYLLIRGYKTRFVLWNTNNTDRNSVNKQNTHALTHTHTANTRKGLISMKISDTPLF